ncbi:Lipopolysaccharide-assembly, LptC-related [Afipia felis]|uniref:Lipopolysaccharide-assembly, LptC-related n=1 Tax=Afipia felis TaxID=1035 RepID=A0A090MUF8_AFIFE|nr:LPS export ABC transporter periplasmic protein LptC [Afipia felis]CEG09962.1 Lipopolysaccharide-assembly, LptC-related [Afipia felis]
MATQTPAYQGDDPRFVRAARHSRRVRWLRRAVPAVVILSLALIIGASVFNPFRFLKKLPIDLSKLSVSGTKITMDAPHLASYLPDRRPYEVWAKAATQDVTDPTKVDMLDIRAQVQMQDKSTLRVDAQNGHFDTKTQLLDLTNQILLQTTTGYQAQLTQARVDLATGIISSDQPVAVKLTNGTLNSQNLRITDHGASAVFGGGVTMLLDPPADKTNADATAGSAPADAPAESQ